MCMFMMTSIKVVMIKLRYLLSSVREYWLLCFTAAFIIVAIVTPILTTKLEDASNIAAYLSSYAAVLAFVWLIASFRLQFKELTLQRSELTLQRQAIELQTKQIQSMSEYAALEQVANVVNGAVQNLAKSNSGVTQPEELFQVSMPTAEWAILLESTNPQEVYNAYKNWGIQYGAATHFLASMTVAAKLYLKSTNNTSVDYSLSDASFFYINKPWIEQIPHISEYFNNTYLVAEAMTMLEPGVKSIHLAGATAIRQLISKEAIDKKYVEELISYHRERSLKGPAIARLTN